MTSQRNLVPGWFLGLAAVSTLMMTACGSAAPASPAPPAPTPGAGKPAGFGPTAVSFVSPARGWVLGRSGCQDCAGLLMTRDGGVHWTALPAPLAPLGYYNSRATAVTDMAFADDANGFLYPDFRRW